MAPVSSTRSLIHSAAAALAALMLPAAALAADPGSLHVPPGFKVTLVAQGLPGVRFIAVAPNGDVIAATPRGGGRVFVVAHDAKPDQPPSVFADGIAAANGVAFHGDDLYVAGIEGVTRFQYPNARPQRLFNDMPQGPDHNLRAIAIAGDKSIFVSSGSTCNVCRETDARFATILHYDADGRSGTIYARGLRNTSGLAFDARGRLWAVVNQRDNISSDPKITDDLPPDELDEVRKGGDYGWPWCYPDGARRLPNPEFSDPARCATALPTTLNIQAHSAPLQATFYEAKQFPQSYRGALFVAFHGSWNRTVRTGYKVVAVIFRDGKPQRVEDFMTGFLNPNGGVIGRPVGVAVAPDGSLYVSDDRGFIYRVTYG